MSTYYVPITVPDTLNVFSLAFKTSLQGKYYFHFLKEKH